ncbi:MAG: exonuclease domain-containing protein [Anaerolineae bacterium]|nr:exonuclease domain-containing protein [Anaerolineae bacterium]
MGKKLERVLVIDVESTCWEGDPPDGQEGEIIEIGICVLDVASGDRLAKDSILVKPERSLVSPFCTQLTTLTQDRVAQGVSFERACGILKRKYRARHCVWASYGNYDRCQFERQCHARGIEYPFGPSHINVKNLFAVVFGLPREVGMVRALHMLSLPVEGVHHRGVDDAWNTGLLLSRLLLASRAALKVEAD